jgi:hypothetical protein
VAFGGRVLEDDAGRNTSTPPIRPSTRKAGSFTGFTRGARSLRARARPWCGRLHGCRRPSSGGRATAVAPLGTALTADQARLLRRYAQEAVLLFDPDPAGQNASWRSAAVFLRKMCLSGWPRCRVGRIPTSLCWRRGRGLEQIVGGRPRCCGFLVGYVGAVLGGFSDLHGRFVGPKNCCVLSRRSPTRCCAKNGFKRAAARLDLGCRCPSAGNGPARGGSRVTGTPGRRNRCPNGARRSSGPACEPRRKKFLQVLAAAGALWEAEKSFDELFSDTRCLTVFRHWREQWKSRRRWNRPPRWKFLGAADGPWLTACFWKAKVSRTRRGAWPRGRRLGTSRPKGENAALEGSLGYVGRTSGRRR